MCHICCRVLVIRLLSYIIITFVVFCFVVYRFVSVSHIVDASPHFFESQPTLIGIAGLDISRLADWQYNMHVTFGTRSERERQGSGNVMVSV